MKGKDLSLESKVFAVVFVLGAFIVKLAFRLDVSTWDILQVGMFFALVFAPVDVSLWLEKFGKKG